MTALRFTAHRQPDGLLRIAFEQEGSLLTIDVNNNQTLLWARMILETVESAVREVAALRPGTATEVDVVFLDADNGNVHSFVAPATMWLAIADTLHAAVRAAVRYVPAVGHA